MRIGVLLGGCGHYDGTDVCEAVLTLLALEEEGEKPVLIAPRRAQERVVDHLTADEMAGGPRDILQESARMWRGRIQGLDEIRPDHLEALIIPGGYGPAVNFSTGFGRAGEKHAIVPEVESLLRHFLDSGKPIGCISLGEIPVRTVLGQAIEMSAPPPDPATLRLDPGHAVAHTPGFSAYDRLRDVQAGIRALVRHVVERMAQRAAEDAARTRGERP